IDRCLAKNPAERYASTREIARELAALQSELATRPGRWTARRATPPPAPPTSLLGRRAELEALRDLVHRPDGRLATLTGPGGTGKTRLAAQLADELYAEYEGSLWFVSLAAASDPARVIPQIAEALGIGVISGPEGTRSLAAELARLLPGDALL